MNLQAVAAEGTMPTPLSAYSPPDGRYDEMVTVGGEVRPHWMPFASRFSTLDAAEINRRSEEGQRLMRESGVAYMTGGRDDESRRPWELDPVPLVIDPHEWKKVAEGLEQRARLFNLVLADVYGPQRLIREGVLPPELLFEHPRFLRPLHGLKLPEQRHLHLYAADLARSADGQWWVVGDRGGAPNGTGYALQNRIVTSRMFPDIFRECHVERLASFFITLRDSLHRLAARYQHNPRIVLLSRGPQSRNYFEDVYLARYLGYTLVETGDLAVRDNRVMLKTLAGLLPIEVIFRRIDDADCDPVELGTFSVNGVPGLLEALRAGNVAMANAPGSGLVESPALLAFLQAMCEFLLGEELKLPTIATWWCGEEEPLKYVLEHFDDLLLRPAFRHDKSEVIDPATLGRREREELQESLRSRPACYVAQERVSRSTTPVWTSSTLKPWHLALRTYVVADADDYVTMPGGLVRVSSTSESLDHSMSAGERSQDAWLPATGPVQQVSLLQPPGQPIELRRSGAELPSRVADNLYWLGRQVERAEGNARVLRSVLSRLTSELDAAAMPELPVLLRTLAAEGQLEPGFVIDGAREHLPNIEHVLPEEVFNEGEARSLRSTINEIVRLASMVRDRISIDSWNVITRIDRRCQKPRLWGGRVDPTDVLAMLNQLMIDLSAFSGFVIENMTRTLGWRFLDVGRRLERCLHTSTLLQSAMLRRVKQEETVLEALLEVADGSLTYRSRYLSNIQPAPVLDLLLTDETNPRSIAFQLESIVQHVDRLPRDTTHATRGADERVALSLLNSVRLAEVETLCQVKGSDEREQLDRLLKRLHEQLPKLSEAISHRYLIHVGVQRHFGRTPGVPPVERDVEAPGPS